MARLVGVVRELVAPVRVVVLPHQAVRLGREVAGYPLRDPARAAEVGVVAGRLVGGEVRLAGVYVGVLSAVRPALGPVGPAVAPEAPGAVTKSLVEQVDGRAESGRRAVDAGGGRPGVREQDERVSVRRARAIDRRAVGPDDEVISLAS
jgi:hypothetical protein